MSPNPWDDVVVPANIDAQSCKTESTDFQTGECSTCCSAAGFSASSTIYDDHCTCGDPLPDMGHTECMDQAATAELCSACCSERNYNINGWVGGASPQCTCDWHTDSEVCKSALTADDPSEACAMCCVTNGYVSMFYIGIGEPECSCR